MDTICGKAGAEVTLGTNKPRVAERLSKRIGSAELRWPRPMKTPKDLHDWVHGYNWDDGLDPIWPIVESDTTEFATALLIYWRVDGPWFQTGARANEEATRLHTLVERRLLAGCYDANRTRKPGCQPKSHRPRRRAGDPDLHLVRFLLDGAQFSSSAQYSGAQDGSSARHSVNSSAVDFSA
jgi:hypothetical protein